MIEDYVFCQEVHLAEKDDDVSRVDEEDNGQKKDLPRRHLAHVKIFFEQIF